MAVLRSLLIFMILSIFTAGAAFALTQESFDVKKSKQPGNEQEMHHLPFKGKQIPGPSMGKFSPCRS